MLLDGVNHINWIGDFPTMGIYNPGAWGKNPYNPVSYEWMGADANGYGAVIPPYDNMHMWIQRVVEIGLPSGGSHKEYLSLFPNYHGNEGAYLAQGISIADPTHPANLPVSIEGYAVRRANSPIWDYFYLVHNNTAESLSAIEFQVEEDDENAPPHQGFHDEFDFRNATGQFAYDADPLFGAINSHNYDWSSLSLEAGEWAVLGFSDTHAPTLEEWAISTPAGGHYESVNRLPVPSVPDSGATINLLLVSLAALVAWKGRRRLHS